MVRKDQEGKEFIPEIKIWNPVVKRCDSCDTCSHLAHQDFVKAVARLADHMVILWNADKPDNFEQSEFTEEFEARGFSLKGGGDEVKVTIKGHRKTTFAGAMTANSTLRLEQDMDAEGSYPFIDDLQVKIKRISMEALLYYYDQKAYEDAQLSLSLPDPEEKPKKPTKAQILPPVTPESIVGSIVNEANGKKGTGGKKRVPQSSKHPSGEAE